MNSITERRVIHQVKIDPKISAPKIAASTSNTLGCSVSAETVGRVLRKAGYNGNRVPLISGLPPIDLVILNNLDVWENYLSTSLGMLDGTIPVPLLPHPSCRKPITLVTYTNEVFQKYKTVCFTDGSKLNGRVGLACVIYEEGVENVTFQHRLRDECSVF
ncbi:transforming growth factor-beta-induced protein ig-h3 [Trichonephila clavipes]|nr:transforming growth factor-beta-induced protein ig-h3 [Trichonephila clavipes]